MMSRPRALILPHRGVLKLTGPDVRSFLQGIVSNDVDRVSTDRAVWAAFLTPQGKFLHEFYLIEAPDAADSNEDQPVLLLDCEKARRDDLLRRLSLYKLRAQVALADADQDYAVAALFGEDAFDALGLPEDNPGRAVPFAGGRAYVDPRLADLGARAVLPRAGSEAALATAGFAPAEVEAYDRLRIALGVPDGSRDLEVEKSLLLESGFEELNGLDWDKGCYMGQELTARVKYRGLVKKRLLPVRIEGPVPAPGTPVRCGDRDGGIVRSTAGKMALALLRLEYLDDDAAPLTAGEARLTPVRPEWARF
jgi:hypothetical protein